MICHGNNARSCTGHIPPQLLQRGGTHPVAGLAFRLSTGLSKVGNPPTAADHDGYREWQVWGHGLPLPSTEPGGRCGSWSRIPPVEKVAPRGHVDRAARREGVGQSRIFTLLVGDDARQMTCAKLVRARGFLLSRRRGHWGYVAIQNKSKKFIVKCYLG